VTLVGSVTNAAQEIAYIATGSYGLAIVDVSNFQTPIVLGQVGFAGNASDVAVDPALNLAAVADRFGGLRLVNVVDPANPALAQTIPINATAVEVVGGIAYANDGSTLDAIDLATGTLFQTLDLGGSTLTGMARDGSKLYTMDSSSNLRVIDISGDTMVLEGSATLPYPGNRIFAANGVVYVGTADAFNGGYATVDVSNPSAPTLIQGREANNIAGAAIALNGSGLGLTVGRPGGVFGTNAVDVVNTSDPTNTGQFVTRFTVPAQPYDVAIGGGIGFIADGSGGLQVVNYKAFDTAGIAATLTITQLPADVDPNTPGLQLAEGEFITVGVTTSDDVQVPDVQLLVNGQVVENQVSYPWNIETTLPSISANGSNQVTLQVEATDTGGNNTFSMPIQVTLVPDPTVPAVVSQSVYENAVEVAGFRALSYTFSRAIDSASLDAAHFRLIGPGGTAIAPVSIEERANGTVHPTYTVEVTYSSLALGQYQAQVDASVRDTAGVAFGSELDTDFTVTPFTDVWSSIRSGDWNSPSNWSTGVVPIATDDVYLGLPLGLTASARGLAVSLNSLVENGGGTLDIIGGSLAVTNAAQISGNLVIDGATFAPSASATIADLTLTGFGGVTGTNPITITALFDWVNGDLYGSGTTIVAPNAVATIGNNTGLSRELDIFGQATLLPYVHMSMGRDDNGPGTLVVEQGGTLTLSALADQDGSGDNTIENAGGGNRIPNPGTVQNAGTLLKTGTGTSSVDVPLTNSSNIDVQSGALNLTGGGTSTGSITIEAGATLGLITTNFSGAESYTIAVGSSLSGTGSLSVYSAVSFCIDTVNLEQTASLGSVSVDGGVFNVDAPLTVSSLSLLGHAGYAGYFMSAMLAGAEDVTVTSSLTWTAGQMSGSGKTFLSAGATGTLVGNQNLSREIDIGGQLTIGTSGGGNSTIQLGMPSAPGIVNILSGGTLAIWGAVQGYGGDGIYNEGNGFPLANPGYLENAGTLIGEGGGSTGTINVGVINDASGTIDVQSGTLDLAGGGSSSGILQDEAGATLEFGGGSFTLARVAAQCCGQPDGQQCNSDYRPRRPDLGGRRADAASGCFRQQHAQSQQCPDAGERYGRWRDAECKCGVDDRKPDDARSRDQLRICRHTNARGKRHSYGHRLDEFGELLRDVG
jgi:hypothetical protein